MYWVKKDLFGCFTKRRTRQRQWNTFEGGRMNRNVNYSAPITRCTLSSLEYLPILFFFFFLFFSSFFLLTDVGDNEAVVLFSLLLSTRPSLPMLPLLPTRHTLRLSKISTTSDNAIHNVSPVATPPPS